MWDPHRLTFHLSKPHHSHFLYIFFSFIKQITAPPVYNIWSFRQNLPSQTAFFPLIFIPFKMHLKFRCLQLMSVFALRWTESFYKLEPSSDSHEILCYVLDNDRNHPKQRCNFLAFPLFLVDEELHLCEHCRPFWFSVWCTEKLYNILLPSQLLS